MASQMVTPARRGMFLTQDGRNVVLTFALVSSLFLLWGFCNGLIDVMDKHFQDELGLSKAQSAWVQFAHYLGYFLMSIPAGWLASQARVQGRDHRRTLDCGRWRSLVSSGDRHQQSGAIGAEYRPRALSSPSLRVYASSLRD